MFATKDIAAAIKGHYCCDISEAKPGRVMDCDNCPYNDNELVVDYCVDRLHNDIQYYLKLADKLIKESEKADQPTLPGIFDNPQKNNGKHNKKRRNPHGNS